MSKNVFLEGVVVKDGNLIYDPKNQTVLVELIDEEGNRSEQFVPTAFVNLEIDSANIPAPETHPNSTADSFNTSKKIEYSDSSDCTENDEENSQPSSANLSAVRLNWSSGQTKRLLSLFNDYLPKVGPMKKFRTKKNMFEKIASTLNEEYQTNFDWNQCSNRQKAVLRQHKIDVKVNRTSGATRKDLEFEEEIEAMKAVDDSIEPEVLIGVGKIEKIKKKAKADEGPNVGKKGKQDLNATANITGSFMSTSTNKPRTIQDTLLLISQQKEQKRDERHMQRLEMLRELLTPKTDNY